MKHATFFISQSQYDWLATALPQPPSTTKHFIPNNELLNGILFVLKTGCRWQDVPASVCVHGYSSCWRRLRFWQKHRHLKVSWQRILLILNNEGTLDLSLGNLDGSLVQAPQYAGVGYDSQHHRYGTNISLLTDKQGVPLVNMTFKGNRNDIVCAEATMNKLRVGARRRVLELNADKGYDSKTFVSRWRGEVPKPTFRSVSSSTAASVAVSPTWIKVSSHFEHSQSGPMPGSSRTGSYATGTNRNEGCFRRLLT